PAVASLWQGATVHRAGCLARGRFATVAAWTLRYRCRGNWEEGTMYKVWYWTMVDRDSEGRFIASVPDLVDVAAYGATERDALANVTQLAEEHVRALVERGQSAPRASRAAEMPSAIRSKEFGRALIPVEVGRASVRPSATH